MLWSHRVLPVRIRTHDKQETVPYTDTRVQLLPVKARSVCVLADNFRWIVKHIQTFSKTKLIPTYKKQGTSSLTRLGFTAYHQGGLSRRPTLPNVDAAYKFLEQMLLNMPHNPPFHTEIPMPALPDNIPAENGRLGKRLILISRKSSCKTCATHYFEKHHSIISSIRIIRSIIKLLPENVSW